MAGAYGIEKIAAVANSHRPRSLWTDRVWPALRTNPPGAISLVFLLAVVLASALAPLVAPYDPDATTRGAALLRPSAEHLFGTDNLGRDILSRILYGGRISLTVGIAVALFGTMVGACIGVFSAYLGGKVDLLLQRLVDCLNAFPALILALLFMVVFGGSLLNVVAALCVVNSPRIVRTVRSVALSVKESDYVKAAQALGAKDTRVVLRHVLPNCLTPVIILASTTVGWAILIESSLSFLGMGVPPNIPTWGGMLGGQAQQYVRTAPWLAIFPGLILSTTVLAMNLLGDTLRDILDPRLRGRV